MNNSQEDNQTQFAFEEPIFQDLNVELPVEPTPIDQNPKKSIKFFIIIGLVVLTLLILFVIVMLRSKKKTPENIFENIQQEVIKNFGPLEQRIENARIDLDAADPANQDLTFPPVDMGLRLDKKEK
ncbi:MAG: hypothetical protein H6772_00865 [Pseudomonadales bacterium]|nr:hypothetical protein [Pseudomonadales bacterium]